MNPWHKRANEFIRDPAELLPLISPQPIHRFFGDDASRLFDRLVVVIGTPGSGKTTLARLLELRTLVTMREFSRQPDVRVLAAALAQAGVLDDLQPAIVALRLPAGGQLRAIWELPYQERLRHRLLRQMIQAKSVLGWLRQLEDAGVDLEGVQVILGGVGDAARESLGSEDVETFRQRAREAERAIFKLIGALVPPSESDLGSILGDISYEPFSVIESFVVGQTWMGSARSLKPMVMIDDAHELHPAQLQDVDLWLRDREIKVARWILTRADSLDLVDYRRVLLDEDRVPPGTQPGRDRIRVPLQDAESRADRSAFKAVAEDVARRYLAPLPVFNRRGNLNLKHILDAAGAPSIAASELAELKEENAKLAGELGVGAEKLKRLESAYPVDVGADVRLALTRIMLHRERRRTPQRSLFGNVPAEESGSELPKVSRALATGAELHLLHRFDRPFYFGFDRLAEASDQNIERFVSLTAVLVDQLETQLIRAKQPRLDAKQQHRGLREHANELIRQWDFPYAPQVKRLVRYIADRCLDITLRPNAPLDDGANAFGVHLSELVALNATDELSRVIHYALAYQALVLVEPYDCKGKTWGLLELGGLPIIAYGLPLSRGGFAEGTLAQLRTVLEDPAG